VTVGVDVAADGIGYELTRLRVTGGEETTVYVVRYPAATTRVKVVRLPDGAHLDEWCAQTECAEAIVAGFFLRDPWRPLGALHVGGAALPSEPIPAPWADLRACVHVAGDGTVRVAPRHDLPAEPDGDLVQAGPLLVTEACSVIDGGDPEGFSAGAAQFDSDITAARHPRCALGLADGELLAVCCDGRRTGVDAGLELAELARLLVSLGADEAINLDGGGSATLVHRGHLLNRPYSDQDQPRPASRPVVTALVFEPR
jgi:hypothetical protein